METFSKSSLKQNPLEVQNETGYKEFVTRLQLLFFMADSFYPPTSQTPTHAPMAFAPFSIYHPLTFALIFLPENLSCTYFALLSSMLCQQHSLFPPQLMVLSYLSFFYLFIFLLKSHINFSNCLTSYYIHTQCQKRATAWLEVQQNPYCKNMCTVTLKKKNVSKGKS